MRASSASPGRAGLLTGEVAKRLAIGVQTLYFYEREGLIPPADRSDSGYRLYTLELVERVAFIKKAQALGLPLDEIKEILRLAEEGACPCGHVQAALAAKLADVDRRLRELRTFRRELAALVERSSELSAQGREARICSIVESATVPRAAAPGGAPVTSRRARSRLRGQGR
jgi:DNA-binding transcriptional MerR regulator